MSNVFIAYSEKDSAIARDLNQAVNNVGAKVFLAELSLVPGADAHTEIFEKIRSSDWVFFIASYAACKSSFVQQELGACIGQQKQIIPLLIDISPSQLPGFMTGYQAIDGRTGSAQLHKTIEAIGKQVQADKFLAGLILGAIATAVLMRR